MQGICSLCNKEMQVKNILGVALCAKHEKKVMSKDYAKVAKTPKSRQPKTKAGKEKVSKVIKKQERKIARALRRNSKMTVIYVASAKKVEEVGKNVAKKIARTMKRKERKLARIDRLKASIVKAEERVKAYEVRLSKLSIKMQPTNFISQEQLKKYKIESYGKTKDGGDRIKVKGLWYIRPPTLTGEKLVLAQQLGKVKEKKLTRKLVAQFESSK